MNITENDADMLAELYGHLLWFEKFSDKLPNNLTQLAPSEIVDAVKYLCGWVDGVLYHLPNGQTP